ncbi:MAG: EMC3/TMCO1 family protein [Candidatus Bathyarchaeia archaeon]
MASFDVLLYQPASTLFVLLVSFAACLMSMIVYRYTVDLKRLSEVSEEVRRYNEDLTKAKKSGDKQALRRLKREERRLRQLSSYAQRQRLKATMVTVIPFSIISLMLGLFYSGRAVATLPFETPFGKGLNFYTWYMLCYFAIYFPLTRLFGVSMSSDIPRSAQGS